MLENPSNSRFFLFCNTKLLPCSNKLYLSINSSFYYMVTITKLRPSLRKLINPFPSCFIYSSYNPYKNCWSFKSTSAKGFKSRLSSKWVKKICLQGITLPCPTKQQSLNENPIFSFKLAFFSTKLWSEPKKADRYYSKMPCFLNQKAKKLAKN